jgi:hypothetical protein
MVHITQDAPAIHAGATLIYAANSGKNIAAAEGSVARFLDTGTATASTYGVEIHSTNNTGLHLTTGAVGASHMLATALEAQTSSMITVDGSTGTGWDGADNVGMLHLVSDSVHVHAGATMLYVANSAQSIAAAEGTLARFINTGAAQADASMIEITAKDETEYALTVTAGISNFEANGICTAFGGGTDLDATPTAAQFTTEFTATALTRPGFIGVAEDTGDGKNYLVVSDGTTWHYVALTAAS